MAGGLTYGSTKDILGTVVENGVSGSDPRVLIRTNEATKAILDETIPVGGMITADVQASGTTLLLPKEFENAIEVEPLGTTVNGSSDVAQGWYNIVNQFAFVDPSAAHDNPLVDQYLQPDPGDPTILRRQYDYPGLTPNAIVRVTGAKRYVPITADGDYLIVQNILALKDMIQSIERKENNDPAQSEIFHKSCIDRINAEVKKHQLDPINSMKRKAGYDRDLATLGQTTFGYFRARLAFELPGGLQMGKSELNRVMEQAEMRFFDRGQWVGTLEEYEAQVTHGHILCPREVDCILATSWNGHPLHIESIFHKFIHRGHRWWGGRTPCLELRDEGEQIDSQGFYRRQYRLVAWTSDVHTLRFIAALRWVKKGPTDQMQIRNFEAMRLMCSAIIQQKDPQTKQAGMVDEQAAIAEVDSELTKHLSGQIIAAPVDWGMGYAKHGVL